MVRFVVFGCVWVVELTYRLVSSFLGQGNSIVSEAVTLYSRVTYLKIKKPMAKDNMVFPVYNFEHVQDLPFHHCMALIKSIVDLQRLANLSDGYPLMPDLTGTWLPLAGMLLPDATRAGRLSNAHQQPPPLRHAAVSLNAGCSGSTGEL